MSQKLRLGTLDLIDTFDPEVLTGVQLMIANERELSDALEKLEKPTPHFKNIRAIDLNFGCPSQEVAWRLEGCRWQRRGRP